MELSHQFTERLIVLRSRQERILSSAASHPLFIEVEQRLKRLTSLLSLSSEIHSGGHQDQLIEKAPVLANKIVFEISRCEFIMDQFENRQLIKLYGDADFMVYPPLRLVFVQKVIQGILFLKNAIFRSKDKYRSWNMWHLAYLKNDLRISRIMKRILFKHFG